MLSEVLVIFILVLINGLLSGSEIAVVAVRRTRLQELVESGSSRARAVQRLRDDPERFLATVQIGITIIGATAGAFGGSTFAEDLRPAFEQVSWLRPYAGQLSLALVISLVSYLSLVVGELVPKSLALRAAESYALLIGRPLLGLSWISRPLVWFLTASSNVVLRIFGDRTTFTETRLSREELQQMVDEAAKAGTVHPHAGEIASRALDFAELTAADVMVPRNRVIAIPRNASFDEVRRILLEHTHTRMPVYEGTIDNVVGYISVKDVLSFAWENKLIVLEDLIRPPYFVPEVKKAVDLLQEMRARRVPFAIIVDEQGGMSGIVAMEDLVEELVGEIFSEHERHVPELIRREPSGAAVVNGTVSVRDVNRALDLELPEDAEWSTIAGLCIALAGRIPQAGEKVTTPNGITLEVVDASPRRVRALRVWPAREPSPHPPAS